GVAVVPPLTFLVLNYAIHRFRLSPLDADPANLGTVFFPFSFAVLLAVFFRPGEPGDQAFLAVAGLLTMALGDAAAALFGKRYGTRRYTILGHSRTMEGSMAMFLVTAVVIAVVLNTMAGYSWHPAVAFGLVTGTAAAGIEAVCPFGSDNLFVPIGTAGILWALVEVSSAALGVF
ncbi:MAG: phosphatidate cytidylyltransferase, partial [Gammaproteobacteria bacterium]|nr:phosphatidate cytidylyltransferase [Gammaproteobacteria bacterium]